MPRTTVRWELADPPLYGSITISLTPKTFAMDTGSDRRDYYKGGWIHLRTWVQWRFFVNQPPLFLGWHS